MKILIDQSAQALGIDKVCLLCCLNLQENDQNMDQFNQLIHKQCLELSAPLEARDIIEKSYLEFFKIQGYVNTIPAGIKMNKIIQERGFKKISNIIDCYNIISAKYSIGIGGHNKKIIDPNAPIILKRSNGTEQIIPLFKNKNKKINFGDLIYTNNQQVIAWIGEKDIDSDLYKITQDTQDVFFIIIGRVDISKEILLNIANDIQNNIAAIFKNVIFKIDIFE